MAPRPALAATAFALAGCGAPGAGDSLFPLDAGRRWEYAVTAEPEAEALPAERSGLVITARGEDRIDLASGQHVRAHRRDTDAGASWWHVQDAHGTRRVAEKHELEAEPRPDPGGRWVLKAPVAPGTNWQVPTTTYLLKRRNDFPPELRHVHPPVPMAFTIEAVGEAVTAPAGRFEGCVRVRGEARLRLADPVAGWRDVPLVALEWYCPGVGLVRLERHELARSPFYSGGRVTMELVAWK